MHDTDKPITVVVRRILGTLTAVVINVDGTELVMSTGQAKYLSRALRDALSAAEEKGVTYAK